MSAAVGNNRVLIVCLSGSPVDRSIRSLNGIESAMFNLAALLLRRGKTVSFAVATSSSKVVNISERCRVFNIPVAYEQPGLAAPEDYYCNSIAAATEACIAQFPESHPDIVISCSVASGIVACSLAEKWSTPHMHYLMSGHNTLLVTTVGLADESEFPALLPVASLPAMKDGRDATVRHYMIEHGTTVTEVANRD